MRTIHFTLDVETPNPLNGAQGNRWATSKRRKAQRQLAMFSTLAYVRRPVFPIAVKLTRLSVGTLDDDSTPAALKSIRDGIADALGVKDNDLRVTWSYAQQKCKRGEHAVRVVVEASEVAA